ncbi:hypothetical protein GF336_02750 [Candidatus Woesearchaeota archaeon]|nr:hypothetical protein [Candidatus Woesearchaeota archaeon]
MFELKEKEENRMQFTKKTSIDALMVEPMVEQLIRVNQELYNGRWNEMLKDEIYDPSKNIQDYDSDKEILMIRFLRDYEKTNKILLKDYLL